MTIKMTLRFLPARIITPTPSFAEMLFLTVYEKWLLFKMDISAISLNSLNKIKLSQLTGGVLPWEKNLQSRYAEVNRKLLGFCPFT